MSDVADRPQLFIDGEEVQVSRITENQYATLLIPHLNRPYAAIQWTP
jgi:hypothetical protein